MDGVGESGRGGSVAEGRSVRRWPGVFALLVIVLISYVDRVNVSVLITDPAFTEHFGITGNRTAQGALTTFFLLGYGLAAFLLIPFYEARLGVRRGLVVSVLTWALFTLASPYAFGALVLTALRLLLGAAEGPLFSLKTMYVKEHFAPHEVGKPNAVSSMGVSLGTAVGLPLVAFLVQRFDWHASFLVLALLNAAVGLPLVLLCIPRTRRGTPSTPQAYGAGDGQSGGPSPAPRASRRASRAAVRAALRTPRLGWIVMIEIATLAYLWGSTSWLPSYLIDERGFSLAQSGALSSLPFLMSLASGLLGGWLIDRMPARRVPLLFAAGSVGTGVCVAVVISAGPVWLAAAGLILANGFWGLQSPAIPTLVQQYAEPGGVGTAYGIVNGAGNLVSAFMPALMGMAITATGGFAAGYTLLLGTQVITLFCSLWLLFSPGRGGEGERQLPPHTDGAGLTASG